MSEASTAAPSAGAQSDNAQPATGQAEQVESQQVAAPKPIKPIPASLPGVFPDDDPFPAPPPDGASPPGPARGPDGRFVAATSTAPVEGEHSKPQGEPQPAKFKIAGEEYDSQEAFEQHFKSLRGNFKPLQSLAKSLGGVDKVVPQFAAAAESARGWKAEAERLRAELDARQPVAPAASQPSPEAASDGIDWELYAEVNKLATEAGEPHRAQQWLIEQVQKAERTRYEGLLDQRLAPFTQAQQKAGVYAQAAELFGNLRDYELPDGSSAFPELGDPEAASEIGQHWASLGGRLEPQWAVAAIGLYRMNKALGSQASPAAQAPSTAPSIVPPLPTDAHAAATLSDGRPIVASVGANGSQSAEAARILAGLRSVNGNRAALGFEA